VPVENAKAFLSMQWKEKGISKPPNPQRGSLDTFEKGFNKYLLLYPLQDHCCLFAFLKQSCQLGKKI